MTAEVPSVEELRARIAEIERDIDAGAYHPGPWARLVRAVRSDPDDVRASLAGDITRVSRKLHMRSGRRTIAVGVGIAIEIAAIATGAALIALALAVGSNLVAILAMAVWVTAFQPPVKVAAGTALGVGYDYVFLQGVEPRFKMSFGSYLAAPRWKRVVLHLSGTVGSPLAAIIAARITGAELPIATVVSQGVFWLIVAINVMPMIASLFGVQRMGPIKLGESSGGAAGIELREALGL